MSLPNQTNPPAPQRGRRNRRGRTERDDESFDREVLRRNQLQQAGARGPGIQLGRGFNPSVVGPTAPLILGGAT